MASATAASATCTAASAASGTASAGVRAAMRAAVHRALAYGSLAPGVNSKQTTGTSRYLRGSLKRRSLLKKQRNNYMTVRHRLDHAQLTRFVTTSNHSVNDHHVHGSG